MWEVGYRYWLTAIQSYRSVTVSESKEARIEPRKIIRAPGPVGARCPLVPPGAADCPHLTAPGSAAEKLIAAIGLQPRDLYSVRHLEPVQDLSRCRIDSPQIALVAFERGVPKFSLNPRHSGNEAIRRDRA